MLESISRLDIDADGSILCLPRRALSIGYYIVKLSVETEDNGLENSDEVFLVIVEESMQASIKGDCFDNIFVRSLRYLNRIVY
jgi:hypothetical protein